MLYSGSANSRWAMARHSVRIRKEINPQAIEIINRRAPSGSFFDLSRDPRMRAEGSGKYSAGPTPVRKADRLM